MKVLDIITEDASVANREAEIIANWLKANPHLEVVEKYDPEASNFASRYISKNKHLNAKVLADLQTRYGAGFAFLKAIGIIAPLTLCILHLRALEAQAQEKDASGNYVHDIEWVKRQENAIVGVFLASQIVRIVYSSIRAGIFVGALRQMLTAVAMRSPGGGRAMIVALIAEQVALAALQTWLNTDEGMQWCTTGLVMPLIIGGIGALGNIGLEFLRDKIKKYTGADVGIVTPTVNQRKDAEKADNSAPSSDDMAKWQAASDAATNPIALGNRIK